MLALGGVAQAVAVAGEVAIPVVSAVMRLAATPQQATSPRAIQCSVLHKVAVAMGAAVMAVTTSLNVPLKANLIPCAPAWT